VNEAANVIREVADPNAHIIFGLATEEVADPNAQIIFGLATDPGMGTDVKLTLIATGFREGDSYEQRESLTMPDMPDDDDLPAFALEDKRRSFFPWVR